jgi:hypothetical protein
MEDAAALVASGILNNDTVEIEVHYGKCIICQENKYPKKKFPLSKATETGILRAVHCAETRENCKDEVYVPAIRRLKGLKNKETGENNVLWHRCCYSDFTNASHIQRLQNRMPDLSGEITVDVHVGASRRSSVGCMDWSKCMFCQIDSKGLSQVQTMGTSAKILQKAVFDKEMSYKLAGVNDLIAAEGKYHLKCYTKFQRNTDKNAADFKEVNSDPRVACFEEIMSSLEKGLCRGHIYSLKAVWTSFSHRLESHYHLNPGVYRGNKLKEKIQPFLQDKITFVQPLNPSEPLLIVSSHLNETAMRSLLNESNVEEIVDDTGTEYEEELNNNDVEAVDLDVELLSWLYRGSCKGSPRCEIDTWY